MKTPYLKVVVLFAATAIVLFSGIFLYDRPPRNRTPDGPALSLRLQQNPLGVVFVNSGNKPIRILKPIDGSEWCWVMPHYDLSVFDLNGIEIKRMGRCGNFGGPYSNTSWPDDYLVMIPPGGEYFRHLPLVHQIPQTGPYRIQMEYTFDLTSGQGPSRQCPEGLWTGRIRSNSLVVTLNQNLN